MNKKIKVAKALRKVAVLLGGRSQEREISLLTGRAVANALQRQNCDVVMIDWQGRVSIEKLLQEQVDCAFIALHGIEGEDGCVQAVLEVLEIPYTGSGVLASALCMDKVRTKMILKANGLPVLEDYCLNSHELSESLSETRIQEIADNLGFPLCVKPVKQGSSVGIYKVTHKEQLKQSIIDASNFCDDIMIEPWLTGREYTVGFLNNKPLPSIWIEPNRDFYDYEAKYITKDTNYHCPSGLSAEQEKAAQDLACMAFEHTACHDWGRVDLVTSENGDFYILEINTVPGLTDTSLVPKAAKNVGISFDALVLQITLNASLKQNPDFKLEHNNQVLA